MRNITCEKCYTRDGKIAVLLSTSFGQMASSRIQYEAAFDKRIIEFWLYGKWERPSGKEEQVEWLNFLKQCGYDGCEITNPRDLKYETIDPNAPFYIYYDYELGGETINQGDDYPLYYIHTNPVKD